MSSGLTTTHTLCEEAGVGLYQGVWGKDGATVTAKVVHEETAGPQASEQLRDEYEALRRLDSRFVLKPLELERQKAQSSLILEGFGGRLLCEELGRPAETGRFLDIAKQLAMALADIHGKGIVHDDLKPNNIFVHPVTGTVKLIGLGSGGRGPGFAAKPGCGGLTDNSYAYMSPQRIGNVDRGSDRRDDLYSLGVIFYQLLTGDLPFQAADTLEWRHCHVARAPQPPAEIVSTIPGALAAITLKLLAKQAEDRYQSAAGLLQDLSRCHEQWAAEGEIISFPLGQHDAPDRFVIPPKLYGREKEVAALVESFEQVAATGKTGLVLVSGYSGIGKSALVGELNLPVVQMGGCFIAGKFDQYRRNIPYATLVQALRTFVSQILGKNESDAEAWRDSLQEAVNPNGQLIVDLIPEVGLILGEQPPVPSVPPQEARNRFRMVLLRFIGVLASPEHPLVLFLDDLQWLDTATLDLLVDLTTESEVRGLLLVGAYRDNEVTLSHPLTGTLNSIREGGVSLRRIVLAPLATGDLCCLIADSLRCTQDRALALAQLLHEKTGGNPFFTIQFLTMLADEKLLLFDQGAGEWTWDLARIHAKGFADNVVDLMLAKLGRLPEATQEALKLFACVGNVAKTKTLSIVNQQSEEALHTALGEAVKAGLVFRLEDAYAFLHDRVQEAAYALVPEGHRRELHLQIGRRLLGSYPPEAMAERVFDVVDQFNRSTDIITDVAERETLRRLNAAAGRKARGAVAYASAQRYLEQAMALLPVDAWDQLYAESLALFLELAECEYLVGNFERADELLTAALDEANTTLDQARVYRLRQRLLQLSGRFREAMTAALEALELFGISMPRDDGDIRAAFDAEIAEVQVNLRGRSIASLADIPLSDDAETQTSIGLLAEASPLIYTARPLLWPLITAKGVNLSLQHGHASESPFVYSCYSMVLVGVCADIPSAIQFSEMALKLGERLPGAAVWMGKLMFHDAAVVGIWGRHFSENLPLLEPAFRACVDSGDLVHAGYLTYNAIWLHLENGAPLEQVAEDARRYQDFARRNHNDVVYNVDKIEEQFALCLQGKTRSLADFSDDTFDEEACVSAIDKSGFRLGTAYHRIMKVMAGWLAGDHDGALAWAKRTEPMLLQVASMANEVTYHFYHALALAALYEHAPAEEQQTFMQSLGAILEKLKLWADNCPANFANRHALVSAEVARLQDRDQEAMQLYEKAIASAHEEGFVQNQAVAYEVAAAFYQHRGYDKFARTYLAEAAARYADWGAFGKVRQLERLHPWLTHVRDPKAATLAEHLDAASVAKAQQAISGEIRLDRLAQTLLGIVVESAGAQVGYLSVEGGAQLRADTNPGSEGSRRAVFDPNPVSSSIPTTIINHVRRSRQTLILADARTEAGRFSADDYLLRNDTRSVLCVPIQRQDKLLAVLYLENNLMAGAFTPERCFLLQVLSSQAAISLETSTVYEDIAWNLAVSTALSSLYVPLVTPGTSIEKIADAVLKESRQLTDSLHGYVAEIEPDTGDLIAHTNTRMLQAECMVAEEQSRRTRFPRKSDGLYNGLWGHALNTGEPFYTEKPTRHPASVGLPEGRVVLERFLTVPVLLAGELVGQIALSNSSRPYTDRDLEAISRIAKFYALAIQHKRAEGEIRTLNQELEQRVADRTARLEAANRELEAFAYTVSHDLRAPLRHIDGFIDLLRRRTGPELDEKSRHYMSTITESAKRMGLLIDELLSFSRLGQQELSRSAGIDLNALVQECIRELEPETRDRAVEWHIAGLPSVSADRALIRAVLVNLISNAVKFTRSRTVAEIWVGSREEEADYIISVRDNGVGFDMQYADKVFGVFERLHRADEFEGTGIGLASVRRIVDRHGGRTWVKAEANRGAAFFFSLPKATTERQR